MLSIEEKAIQERYNMMSPYLNERQRRLFAASEAKIIGHGGISILSRLTGICRETITIGSKELESGEKMDDSQIRKKGGGRKKITEIYPDIKKELEKLIEPAEWNEKWFPSNVAERKTSQTLSNRIPEFLN